MSVDICCLFPGAHQHIQELTERIAPATKQQIENAEESEIPAPPPGIYCS